MPFPGTATGPVESPDIVTQGASDASQAGQKKGEAPISPEVLQLLNGLLSGTASASGAKSNGLSTGTQMTTPQSPTTYQGVNPASLIPQGTFQSRGEEKRANKGALFNNLAQISKSVTDAVQQKKQKGMQLDIERVMGAINGMNEAKSSGDKDQYQHNLDIVNNFFGDPKKAKMLEKAFGVPLLGGDDKKKSTPEYQALVGAFQNYNKAKAGGDKTQMNPRAQSFMQGMPQRTQQDPQSAMAAQRVQQGLDPSADAKIKAQTEAVKGVLEYAKTNDTNATKKYIADQLVATKDKDIQAKLLQTTMQIYGRQGVAETVGRYRLAAVSKMGENMVQNQQWNMAGKLLLQQGKTDNDTKQIGALNNQYKALDNSIKNILTENKNLEADSSWTNSNSDRIKSNTQRMTQLQQQQQKLMERMNTLNFKTGADNADGTSNSGSGSGGESSGQDDRFKEYDKLFEGLLGDEAASKDDDNK